MRAQQASARGVHRGRDLALAREQAHVVRRVAPEEDPRARGRRAREHVHVPREVARGLDEEEAAVAEEVVRSSSRPVNQLTHVAREPQVGCQIHRTQTVLVHALARKEFIGPSPPCRSVLGYAT